MATITVIKRSSGWLPLNIGELYEYRELLYFMIWREIRIRYKQTLLGASWAILQPLFTMLVFTLFFGRLAKMASDGIPYAVFALTGLVPWTFFANGLTQSSNSLVNSAHLITKVYFPRLIIPASAVGAGVLDFTLALLLSLGLNMYFGVYPTLRVLWLPLFFSIALMTALGSGLWLSALNVEYRDIKHTVPFLAQLWMFATPIAYPSSLIPEQWQPVYALNPMVAVVDGFRWCLAGGKLIPESALVVSILAAVTILVSGAYYFRRTERSFSDIV